MGLFDSSPNGEQKRSIFDSEWQNADQTAVDEVGVRIASTAVITLVCGVGALAAFVAPTFIFLAWITLGLAAVSLALISRSEKTLGGKRLVLIGIFLALLPLVALPISNYIYFHHVVKQGREFAALVLHAAQKGETTALYQLKTPCSLRKEVRSEQSYWRETLSGLDPEQHATLHSDFLSHPLLLTLAALGDDAKISFYKPGPLVQENEYTEILPLIYTATYTNAQGNNESFFFVIGLYRSRDPKEKMAMWSWKSFGNEPLKLNI